MAKGKGGKASAAAGPKLRKKHGPKRHMFKGYKPMIKVFADAGVLDKYHDKESFALALAARGIKKDINALWQEFHMLPDRAAQTEWFKNLKK